MKIIAFSDMSPENMEYLLCCTFLVSSPSIESAGRFITRLTAKQTGLCPTYYSKDLLDRPGPFAHRPDQRFGRLANRSEHHLHFSYQHKSVPPLAPESGFADRAVAAWTSRALSPEGPFGGELLQQRQARILLNRNRDKVYLDAIEYKGLTHTVTSRVRRFASVADCVEFKPLNPDYAGGLHSLFLREGHGAE